MRIRITLQLNFSEATSMNNQQGYSVGKYYDQDNGRERWAVIGPCNVWYFPARYGKAAASALCKRLNKGK